MPVRLLVGQQGIAKGGQGSGVILGQRLLY